MIAPLTRFAAAANAVEYGFVKQADLWASLYEHDEAAWKIFLLESRSGDIGKAAADLLASLHPRTVSLLERVRQTAVTEGLFQVSEPSLWRCRPGGQDKNFRSANDLGTAPPGCARAGRLNAAGHSCFYGSVTERGAILESAKHAGEAPEFWIGRFEASRPIHHLDVFEVPDPPSPFALGAAHSHEALAFLRRFTASISQPNDPIDERHYLSTYPDLHCVPTRRRRTARSDSLREQHRPDLGQLGRVRGPRALHRLPVSRELRTSSRSRTRHSTSRLGGRRCNGNQGSTHVKTRGSQDSAIPPRPVALWPVAVRRVQRKRVATV
ncbi:RES family NAD+ phosphorylase [Nocardioides sp. AE5]|uniref:RES family NAD+ phosphorylase n=1 Tax=Nocardioides sp. AE5 TaxID=2962573 RepID=UPI0037C8CA88